jgi:hypothetical protein
VVSKIVGGYAPTPMPIASWMHHYFMEIIASEMLMFNLLGTKRLGCYCKCLCSKYIAIPGPGLPVNNLKDVGNSLRSVVMVRSNFFDR